MKTLDAIGVNAAVEDRDDRVVRVALSDHFPRGAMTQEVEDDPASQRLGVVPKVTAEYASSDRAGRAPERVDEKAPRPAHAQGHEQDVG